MKKKIGGIGLCMLAWSILTCAQTITPQAEQRAREIVSKMTLQEKKRGQKGYPQHRNARRGVRQPRRTGEEKEFLPQKRI